MKFSAIISAFLAATFTVLFLLDYTGRFRRQAPGIAVIEDFEGNVSRLPNGALIWDHAWSGTQLTDGDMVSAGEYSRASILFGEGGLVELGPGTTLALSRSFDKIELQLLTGSATLRSTPNFSKSIILKSRDEGPEASKVHLGGWKTSESASLPTPDERRAEHLTSAPRWQLQEATQDPSTWLNLKGSLIEMAAAPHEPKLLNPVDGERVDLSSSMTALSFQWTEVPGARYVLYVLPAQEGLPAWRLPLSVSHHELKNLPEGSYSWWVRVIGYKTHLSSLTSRQVFHVINKRAELTKNSALDLIFNDQRSPASSDGGNRWDENQPIEIFPVRVE